MGFHATIMAERRSLAPLPLVPAAASLSVMLLPASRARRGSRHEPPRRARRRPLRGGADGRRVASRPDARLSFSLPEQFAAWRGNGVSLFFALSGHQP